MVRIVHFLLQGLLSLSVTKGLYSGGFRVQFDIDATVVAARGIIARFLGILDLFQITVRARLLGQLEHHLVLLFQCLHLFVYFLLGLAEILDSSIAFS